MENIKNYKCPACGGGLSFSASEGKITCPYCDSKFEVKEIEDLYESKSGETQTQESTSEDTLAQDSAQWDTSTLNENWGSDSAGMKEYSCPSCGATIICDATTAATTCPYCDNPTVMQQQFSGSFRPDYVIPFKVEKKQAIELLKDFYNNKPLLPDGFEDQNHLEEIKGVYVPFWFFDGVAYGDLCFSATTEHTTHNGNDEIITTRHYDVRRAGDVAFKMVPVDASKKMDNDLMDSIEPYDYTELKEFSTAYLPGYLANVQDDKVEDCFERANTRCIQTCVSSLTDTVTGYDSVSMTGKRVSLKKGDVHYGLMPVWILNTKWEDKKYVYAINGQTGKVVGELPISRKKRVKRFFLRFILGTVIASAVALAVAYFMGT